MAVSSTQLFTGTLPAGTRNFSLLSVPVGMTRLTLALDRTDWTDANVKIALTLELSLDAGVTWQSVGGLTSEGGPPPVQLPGRPLPANITSGTWQFPEETNSNRRLRGTLVISGGPLKTTATLITDDLGPIVRPTLGTAPASVSFPTQTVGTSSATSATSLTYAYTSPTGQSDTAIHVGVGNTQTPAPTSVTYAGAALTLVVDITGPTYGANASIWRRVTPATGANNVVVSISQSGDIGSGAHVLAGVDQTTPERGTPVTALGDVYPSSGTATVTIGAGVSDATDMCVACFNAGSALSAPNQTERWVQNINAGSTGGNSAGDTAAGSASAITFSRTVAAVDVWRACAFSVRAAAAGGVTVSRTVTDAAVLADPLRKMREHRSLDRAGLSDTLRELRLHSLVDTIFLAGEPRLARFFRMADLVAIREDLRELRALAVRDTAPLADSVRLLREHRPRDLVALTDSVLADYLRAVALLIIPDALSLSETTNLARLHRVADLAALSDSLRILRKTLQLDSVSAQDSPFGQALRGVSLADVMPLVESLRKFFALMLPDALRTTDVATLLRKLHALDAAVLADTTTTQTILGLILRLVTDALSLSDATVIFRRLMLSDGVAVADSTIASYVAFLTAKPWDRYCRVVVGTRDGAYGYNPY